MKLRFLTACLLILSAVGLYGCDDEKSISFDKLPQTAQQFVHQYFPTQNTVRITREKDDGRKNYEVTLDNGASIDFDESGAWTHLESQLSPLPVGFLPQALQTDLGQRYPDATVHEIDAELGGYEIEINNGKTLWYSSDGTFIREELPRFD